MELLNNKFILVWVIQRKTTPESRTTLEIHSHKFDYQNNSKSILYNGSKIDKCESTQNEGRIKALAINTGFNTQRGDLIQNILFPKPTNFSYNKDILIFIASTFIIYIIAVYFYVSINNNKDDANKLVSEKIWKKYYAPITNPFGRVAPPLEGGHALFTSGY